MANRVFIIWIDVHRKLNDKLEQLRTIDRRLHGWS